MKETSKYINIESIIYDYIDQAELTSSHYLRLWNIARRGLVDLNISVAGEPKTMVLNVLPNKTVELPKDYVTWVKVGVFNERNEIATLKYNYNLSNYAVYDSSRLTLTEDAATNGPGYTISNMYNNFYFNGGAYSLFGVPYGTDYLGSFKVAEEQGVIILSSDFESDYVVMEYMCSPVENSDYLISVNFAEALIAWIAWKDIQYKPSGRRATGEEKRYRRKDFYQEKKNSIARESPFRIQDFSEIIRQGYRLSIKS